LRALIFPSTYVCLYAGGYLEVDDDSTVAELESAKEAGDDHLELE
jgi:hypothetical protein